MPVFCGSQSQCGHKIRSVLRGLFRSVLPFLKSSTQFLGKQVLRTGMNIANDVAEGHGFEELFKNRVSLHPKREKNAMRGGFDIAQGMLRKLINLKQSTTNNASKP